MKTMLCSCGLEASYLGCCNPYISGRELPETPEQLMRSRYTAYTKAKIPYIQKTMRGKAAEGYNPVEAKQWAEQCEWLGLKVLNSETNGDLGYVEFIATFRHRGHQQNIHERSRFERIDGVWFYVGGETVTSVSI